MNISQGSLVIVGANTPDCKVFWNGKGIVGVLGVKVDWEDDEQRVKVKVSAADSDEMLMLYGEMRVAGISVKEI